MNDSNQLRANRLDAHRKQAVESLKRCPLCGAINAVVNAECFKCTWAGQFDSDPDRIEAGLTELLDLCPELADAMADTPIVKPTLLSRINHFWNRFLKSLFPPRKVLRRA